MLSMHLVSGLYNPIKTGGEHMKVVIIGAVAAGTSAAAKARRNDETAQITIYDMDEHISYSGCGLPYFIGGEVGSIHELVPRNAEFFKSKYNVDILTRHEVINIDKDKKVLSVKRLADGFVFDDRYDILVLATGALSVVPPIAGARNNNVFILRNPSHALAIKEYIDVDMPKKAVIIGSGFIGLEMAESLTNAGLSVTIVEKMQHICLALDADMSMYLQEYLIAKGCKVITSRSAAEITDRTVVLDDGTVLESDMNIMAVGVLPNVKLAKVIGVELGVTGAIKVNTKMQTNIPGVYACGDCTESYSVVDGQPLYRPLGPTANKMGRITGDAITGGNLEFRGIAGTGIFKVFDMTVASTGMSEKEARQKGYDTAVCHNIKPDKPTYYHGREMVIKAIADKATGKLLGVQIVGYDGVDKRMDVFVTAITYGAKVSDLFHLDLAYAPPFSTTKDPVLYTGMILDNAISRGRELLDPGDLLEIGENNFFIIDTRGTKQYAAGHVDEAVSIPHEDLRQAIESISHEKPVVVYCNKGTTGNAVQNILINRGYKKVYNLSGGYSHYKIQREWKRKT
jgi:NADPH-dependent 2,4-dienoyl-CoA reductase/sulfur reductase-like enzyme/rhodanese-related sulfurtransferase